MPAASGARRRSEMPTASSRLWLLLGSSLLAVDDEKFVLAVRVAHADADARAEAGDGRARGGRACGGGGGRGRGERYADERRGASPVCYKVGVRSARADGEGGRWVSVRKRMNDAIPAMIVPYASFRIVFSMHRSHVSATCARRTKKIHSDGQTTRDAPGVCERAVRDRSSLPRVPLTLSSGLPEPPLRAADGVAAAMTCPTKSGVGPSPF